MRTTVIFEKYELNENGEVKNINTGKLLKVNQKPNGLMVCLTIDGKSKTVNISQIMEEKFPEIIEEEIIENQTEIQTENQNSTEIQIENNNIDDNKSQRKPKFIIRVTELDGTVREFKNFKSGNDFYGLRKDYLNYCISEKFSHMLTRDGLNLKSVEKVVPADN